MRFRVLGDVQVLDGERVVPVAAGRVRSLLGVLLLNANRTVGVEELVERLWPDSPPGNPRAAVQTVVGRLRRALGDGVVRTESTGYLIEAGPAELDLEEFRTLVARAVAAETAQERAALLATALGLWRGEPADAGEQAPRLREERLHAIDLWMDARLRLGEHAALVEPLTELTGAHPLRERFWAQLIVALRRGGRHADAARAYRTVSRLLADELGIDPGDELRAALGQRPRWAVQCQLPMDARGIVGRDKAVARIRDLLLPGAVDPVVPVLTITGPPGVGKSALAIKVAHALRGEFPDGQWYLRLHGREPAELLDDLLRSAGVEPGAIPADEQQRAARLRAHLADRRLLLLLDDADGSAQVRPLLPGTPGCAVIVTSRRELDGLGASHGARAFPVGPLSPGDSAELLVGIAQADLGDLRAAQIHHDAADAAAARAERPNPFIAGLVHEIRGQVHLALGEHDVAVAHLHRAVELFRNGGFRADECLALACLAEVHHAAGHTDAAAEQARTALALAEELGNPRCLANAHNALGAALPADQAVAHFRTALGLSIGAHHVKGRVTALVGLTRATGDPHHATTAAEFAHSAGLATLEATARATTPAHAR